MYFATIASTVPSAMSSSIAALRLKRSSSFSLATQIAYSSCADHTSLLPSAQHSAALLESGEYNFEVKRNEESIFNISGTPLIETIEDTICKASQLTSLRIGDYVAVELKEVSKLIGREEEKARLSTNSCGNDLLGIEVIF